MRGDAQPLTIREGLLSWRVGLPIYPARCHRVTGHRVRLGHIRILIHHRGPLERDESQRPRAIRYRDKLQRVQAWVGEKRHIIHLHHLQAADGILVVRIARERIAGDECQRRRHRTIFTVDF